MRNRETQKAAILRVLRDAAGAWVPLYKIISARGPGTQIGQYNVRIMELRADLHAEKIENRTTTNHLGDVNSEYRLVPINTPKGQGVLL